MVNPFKVGVVFALLFALWHVCWATLVAAGLAQKLLDFVFWMHFITPPYQVEAFDLGRVGVLVGITAAIGMVGGFIGALLWNLFHRAK